MGNSDCLTVPTTAKNIPCAADMCWWTTKVHLIAGLQFEILLASNLHPSQSRHQICRIEGPSNRRTARNAVVFVSPQHEQQLLGVGGGVSALGAGDGDVRAFQQNGGQHTVVHDPDADTIILSRPALHERVIKARYTSVARWIYFFLLINFLYNAFMLAVTISESPTRLIVVPTDLLPRHILWSRVIALERPPNEGEAATPRFGVVEGSSDYWRSFTSIGANFVGPVSVKSLILISVVEVALHTVGFVGVRRHNDMVLTVYIALLLAFIILRASGGLFVGMDGSDDVDTGNPPNLWFLVSFLLNVGCAYCAHRLRAIVSDSWLVVA